MSSAYSDFSGLSHFAIVEHYCVVKDLKLLKTSLVSEGNVFKDFRKIYLL